MNEAQKLEDYSGRILNFYLFSYFYDLH